MTRILALDLGTACGWALGSLEWVPASDCLDPAYFSEGMKTLKDEMKYGTFDLRAGRFSGGGMRFVRFEQELNNFKDLADQVVFEEVRRHRGTDAAHVYGGLLAVLTAWCEKNGLPYEGEPVQTIKKFATGKGNADKQAVVKAVEGWGFQPKNDNEADALALLRLRLSEIAPHVPVSIPEGRREVARKPQLRLAS